MVVDLIVSLHMLFFFFAEQKAWMSCKPFDEIHQPTTCMVGGRGTDAMTSSLIHVFFNRVALQTLHFAWIFLVFLLEKEEEDCLATMMAFIHCITFIVIMFQQALRSIRRATIRTLVGGTVVVGTIEVTTHLPSQGRSSTFYHVLADDVGTPLLRRFLGPEGRIIV
jgi:hypothetical protein